MIRTFLAVFVLGIAAATAQAHETHSTGEAAKPVSKRSYPWGRQGDPARAARTIEIGMADTMRYTPAEVAVKRGETVRFVVRNDGAVLHELVIGTERELREHAEMMRKHPGMEHDEPYMLHVKPGERGEIVWTFDKPGTFHYGCLVPGHWEAGMKGRIAVEPPSKGKPK